MQHEPLEAILARRLSDARLHAGMTVREVAAALHVSHGLIVKYENGDIVPSISRLDALAALFGMTVAALLARHDETMPLITFIDQAEPHVASALAPVITTLAAELS